MTKQTGSYPGVEGIQDRALQLVIRNIWDAVYALQSSVNQPAAAADLSDNNLEQTRRALQAGGSHPIRLDHLQGRPDAPPEIGQWSISADDTTGGATIWDTEDISQADYFTKNSDGTIKILVTGRYHVYAHLTIKVSGAGVGQIKLYQNGSAVGLADLTGVAADSRNTLTIGKQLILKAGDYISANLTTGARKIGGSSGETFMHISRDRNWEVQGG